MNTQAPTSDMLASFFDDFDMSRYPVIARSTQGVILQVREPSLDLAVKIPTGSGLAGWLHRLAIRREHQAYQQLDGMPGFPACFGLFRGKFLALEFLEARPLKQVEKQLPNRDEFFSNLLNIIEGMHQRGVAHGDLKSRLNVMVTHDFRPVIIDFGTTVVKQPGWRPFNHRLFNYLRRIDRNGWVKLKYGRYHDIDPADRHLLDRSLIERVNSRLRRR